MAFRGALLASVGSAPVPPPPLPAHKKMRLLGGGRGSRSRSRLAKPAEQQNGVLGVLGPRGRGALLRPPEDARGQRVSLWRRRRARKTASSSAFLAWASAAPAPQPPLKLAAIMPPGRFSILGPLHCLLPRPLLKKLWARSKPPTPAGVLSPDFNFWLDLSKTERAGPHRSRPLLCHGGAWVF